MKRPELLSPAGTLKALRYAFAFGADAVYAGMPRYSLRVRNNEFDLDHLADGIAEARAAGKRLYVACNLLPHNAKLKTVMADLEPLMALAPDALIMADPGLIGWVRERWPTLPIHLSVQANTMNWAAVDFWRAAGVSRVILSRELSLEEIAEIRERCPDTELEVFVHGALCIAHSGRCLLSGYFNHRDANQGSCTNACRWDYAVKPAAEDEERGVVLIEEGRRPGETMAMEEDEHGTYILNSKDLRAVEHVRRLVEIGVDSLKIEGRTKSPYYAARTAQVYRRAIDDALSGRPFDPTLIGTLENLANRGYTDGFYQRHHDTEYQNYLQGASESHRQRLVGEITEYDFARREIIVEVKNRFAVGDTLELIAPDGNREFVLERMTNLDGEAVEVAPGSGHVVRLPVPDGDWSLGFVARYATGWNHEEE
ncbi:peptidase U32 family protein [Endothiovibrio diazotrophicus]